MTDGGGSSGPCFAESNSLVFVSAAKRRLALTLQISSAQRHDLLSNSTANLTLMTPKYTAMQREPNGWKPMVAE
jgi:hypothetical protein